MKKIVNTKAIAIILLALSISFTSCNRKKKQQQQLSLQQFLQKKQMKFQFTEKLSFLLPE